MPAYFEIIRAMDRIHLLRKIKMNSDPARERGLYFGQLPILEYIIRHEGCTQKDIADYIGVSPASIALSTKRLQKAGVIRKEGDDTNHRCNRLFPTPAGVRLSADCRQRFDALDETTFRGFSKTELEQLSGYLDRMLKNVGDENYRNASVFRLIHLTKLNEKEHES